MPRRNRRGYQRRRSNQAAAGWHGQFAVSPEWEYERMARRLVKAGKASRAVLERPLREQLRREAS